MANNYAVIDIGTLKVKFLIASPAPTGQLEKLYSSNTLTCFGCDMVDDNIIDEYQDRTIAELKRCREKLKEFNVQSFRVVSTHALRRANNRGAVIDRIKRKTDFIVENISSEQEAALFFNAVLRDFPSEQSYALVDMGGGSMQVVIGRKGTLDQMHLLPIGSATLHEKFTRNSLEENSFNTPEDIERMKDYILEQMVGIKPAHGLPIIYGSSNVIDLMKAIGLPLDDHPESQTHPYKTYAAYLNDFVDNVLPLTFAEREAKYQFQRGYMWGIDKAFTNITTLADRLGSPYIIPSNANLAEGLVFSMVA
jgi:exopolyphosphatase/guanosine-5'-triphosphate,3'-diphosphate pyrophosphatase